MPSMINRFFFLYTVFFAVNLVRSAPTFQARDNGYGASPSSAAISDSNSSTVNTTSATGAITFAASSTSVSATTAMAPISTPSTDSSVPDFVKQNGLAAQKLNAQFATMKSTDSCQTGQMACIQGQFAQCVSSKWALSPCSADLTCVALPLVNKNGTSLVCDTQEDALQRFQASGVTGGLNGTDATASETSTSDSDDADDDCEDDGTDTTTADGEGTDDEDCDDEDSGISTSSNEGTPISVKLATPTASNLESIAAISIAMSSSQSSIAPASTITPVSAPESSVSIPSGAFSTTIFNKRQFSPSSASVLSSIATFAADNGPSNTLVSSAFSVPSITAFPTAVPSSTAIPSGAAVVTPTVIIGTDGIVTVTLVSTATVTVPATDCSASPTSVPDTPIPVSIASVSSAVLPSSSSAVFGFSSDSVLPPVITLSSGSPAATASATASPALSFFSLSSAATSTPFGAPTSVSSSAAAVSTSSAGVNDGAAGGAFTFITQVAGTTSPPAAVETGSSVDIAELLTATI